MWHYCDKFVCFGTIHDIIHDTMLGCVVLKAPILVIMSYFRSARVWTGTRTNSSERIIFVWTFFTLFIRVKLVVIVHCSMRETQKLNWSMNFFRKEMEVTDAKWKSSLCSRGWKVEAETHAGRKNLMFYKRLFLSCSIKLSLILEVKN